MKKACHGDFSLPTGRVPLSLPIFVTSNQTKRIAVRNAVMQNHLQRFFYAHSPPLKKTSTAIVNSDDVIIDTVCSFVCHGEEVLRAEM